MIKLNNFDLDLKKFEGKTEVEVISDENLHLEKIIIDYLEHLLFILPTTIA